MGRAASFVARWRATILALAIAAGVSVAWIGSAKADGPGVGTASVVDRGGVSVSAPAAASSAKFPAGKYPRRTI